jgi:hypothetical protein
MIRLKINAPWWLSAIIFGSGFLVLLILSGIWRYLYTPEGWKTLMHDQYYFSIEYPGKWTATKYGESGYRGANEIKLYIYRTHFENFSIRIIQIDSENPTLEEVAGWGENRINQLNLNEDQPERILKVQNLRDYIVEGNKALVRRYGNIGRTYEEVYIARPNDMIIIQLSAEADDIEQFLADFYRIVDSFQTLEPPI